MKRNKMTAIIAGTMLAITGVTVPASATVINPNVQQPTVTTNHLRQVVLKQLTPRPEGIIVAKCMARRNGRGHHRC